jgi:hypothetical protein
MSQGGFNVECESLVVYEKSVYTLENLKINIRKGTISTTEALLLGSLNLLVKRSRKMFLVFCRTFQGTIKQSLTLSESEGKSSSFRI